MSLANSYWLWLAWTQLWQVAVLIAVVALLVRMVAANRPHLAFALWLVVLLKCITPPLWSSPAGVFCWLQPSQGTVAHPPSAALTVAVLPADTVTAHVRVGAPASPGDSNVQSCRWSAEWLNPFVSLTIVWAVGSLSVLVAIAVRRRRIAAFIRRAHPGASAPYTTALADLARRLRIRRSVRLAITEDSVGPAVLGLFRPTVLVPRAVIEGNSADQLELVLAHELIHVRRHDLWLAMLWLLALALWWFHPLVWWAARRASREAERCCDDAVLAELRCSPARYARCLLDILEIKRRFLPVAAFPGVGAIEVNQGRLERIMKIGNRGYRRTPWWCWTMALLAAIAVLPGAAMHISAEEGAQELQSAEQPRPAPVDLDAYAANADSKTPRPVLEAPVGARDGRLPTDKIIYETRSYFVGDVLARIQEERELNKSAAKEFLTGHMKRVLAGPAGDPHNRPQPEQVLWAKNGDHVVIGATRDGHKQVAESIEAIRKFGTVEIAIEVRFLAIRSDEMGQILPDSTHAPMEAPEPPAPSPTTMPAALDRPLASHEGTRIARTQFIVEKDSPMRFRVMDKAQGEDLIHRCQASPSDNVLQAPKVTVFSGQTACVSDTSQSPFVVGLKEVKPGEHQPQIRVVSEGTTLQLRPISDQSDSIHLDFVAAFSKIQKVETVRVRARSADEKDLRTLHIPETATLRMEGGVELKPGQWLLLGGSKADDEPAKGQVMSTSWYDWFLDNGKGQNQPQRHELVLMLRAEKIPLTSTAH